ncbi:MAG: hypothetical protein JSW51_00705, partial [Gemmatimonadota bacterium]
MRSRAVLTVVTLCVACGEYAGPGRMYEGHLSIAPVFATNSTAAVTVGSVQIRITRSDEEAPLMDTTVTVSPDQEEFDLSISVLLSEEEEVLLLSLVLLDPEGVELYRDAGDPTPITISTLTQLEPIAVSVEYVGPGAQATTVEITDTELVVFSDRTLRVNAVARDAQGQVIQDARIGWIALEPLVSFADPAIGIMRAGNTPGEARVVAALPRVRDGAPSIEDTATVTVVVNQVPTADAGSDQVVRDVDLNGSEQITLDGSGSTDADGSIVEYEWREGPAVIATGVNPTVTLSVGDHFITLAVTDDAGATATDVVMITVTAGNLPPSAEAGLGQRVSDADGSGSEPVTLDGSGSSDPDGTIVGYAWLLNGEQIAAGVGPTVDLAVGQHTITLAVTDNEGAVDTDEVIIIVEPNQAPSADAGQNQQVTDTDLSGSEPVTLDGSGSSDPDGTIVGYAW